MSFLEDLKNAQNLAGMSRSGGTTRPAARACPSERRPRPLPCLAFKSLACHSKTIDGGGNVGCPSEFLVRL